MRWARALVAGSAVVAALGAACNALSGVDDLTPVDALDGAVADTALPPATCACEPAAPADWTGPVALVDSTSGPASCPSGTAAVFEGHADLNAPAACSPCACDPPPDAGCAELGLGVFNAAACGAPCSGQVVGSTCGKVRYCAPSQSGILDAEAPAPDGAACSPNGGAVSPLTWGHAVAACALDQGDAGLCASGLRCGVSGMPACVVHAGDVPCPIGPYQTRSVYYTTARDTRTCSRCTCDPPTGVRCAGGVVTLYGDVACKGVLGTISLGEGCKAFTTSNANGAGMITTPATPVEAGCVAHGGDADGSAVPDQPTTACCAPP
jgi:hypothetical protein